jgi:hypothetical protein
MLNLPLLEHLVVSLRAGVAFQRFFVVFFAALAVVLIAVFAAGLSTGFSVVSVVVDSGVDFTVHGIGVAFAVLLGFDFLVVCKAAIIFSSRFCQGFRCEHHHRCLVSTKCAVVGPMA